MTKWVVKMNVIDPDNPIPKYLQIPAWIKDLIQAGRYERGASSRYQIIYESFNVTLTKSEQTIGAVNLKGRIASHLNVPENTAAIFMESLTYDENNVPVELLHSYYRGDMYVFEVELGRYHINADHF